MAGAHKPRALPRLILHAGFHKTGTSSVQEMLDAAREVLSPQLRILLKRDMEALTAATRDHGGAPSPESLGRVETEAARLFDRLDPADPRPLLISSEDLSGLIPGRLGRRGYPEAPALLTALLHGLARSWGALPEVTLYLSTRAPEAWVRSCHHHHLRVARMRDDAASYAAAQGDATDLRAMARRIARALPEVTLATRALEETSDLPHGPLTPLLDLAGVPGEIRDRIPALPPANASLRGLADQFLALNRSELDREALKEAKKALIRKARQG
ncbi:hypothetical protein SAMN06297129_1043 [Pseudooceanicola antarcticus]|uniref:Sulfotransferase family protein n=1 Tax=Pseudooceanicola antarcticus TaxID=1247613 RepID=A0A285IFT4_9RHOB|nr:hypothetical protein [Pseudooceanicola antarcticus]PJE29082.1 hypothetical protein CVM39_11620 [Pseudooceanicola antarcticus]SNY46834.1 hypothetical protein SAMN06297129_1043 [Pseudooceanicola antarcticus]